MERSHPVGVIERLKPPVFYAVPDVFWRWLPKVFDDERWGYLLTGEDEPLSTAEDDSILSRYALIGRLTNRGFR